MTKLLLALLLASSGAQGASSDKICMRSVAFLEAGNQSTKGIAAVVQTIRNRARKRKKSMCSVVRERHQFSSVKKGMKLNKVKISKDFLHKYEKARRINAVGKEYQWFYRRDMKQPVWARKMSCKRVQDHFYCKLKEETHEQARSK